MHNKNSNLETQKLSREAFDLAEPAFSKIKMKSLNKILKKAPKDKDGKKWALFGIQQCLWWTSSPDDADRSTGPLPRCPFCGRALDQKPLSEFIEAAEANPKLYGEDGLATLVAAHHSNTKTCRSQWSQYRIKIRSGS